MAEQPGVQQAGGGSSPAPPIQHFRITQCHKTDVADFIVEHHYSKNVEGVTASVCFRVDRDGELVGAAIFGPPAMKEALDKYSENGRLNLLELRRFCLIDDTPRFTESEVLAVMTRRLEKRGVERVLSYCDPNRGHYGLAYKAAGFCYRGQTPPITEIWWRERWWSTRNLNHYINDNKSLGLREDSIELRAALGCREAKKERRPGKFIFVKELAPTRRKQPTQPSITLSALTFTPLAALAVLTVMELKSAKGEAFKGVRLDLRLPVCLADFDPRQRAQSSASQGRLTGTSPNSSASVLFDDASYCQIALTRLVAPADFTAIEEVTLSENTGMK